MMDAVQLDVDVRQPFDADHLFAFLTARAVPGIEAWDGASFHRALGLPHGHGVATLTPTLAGIHIGLRLVDERDLDEAMRRIRRLLDLDADPVVIDAAFAGDDVLGPLVRGQPGLRVPGSVDPFETAVRAVVGQQISVAGARTVTGRIVAAVGAPLAIHGGPVTRVFPSPDAVAALDPETLPMPRSRGRTIVELATRVARGGLAFDAAPDEVVAALLEVPGIGPWTAGYVRMRGLGDPDVFLPTDLGVRAGLAAVGATAEHAERWRPWRSYALHHLWAAA